MAKLNWSTSNSQITDEIINVASSTAINLIHDVFYNKTGKLVEIWTGAGGTGTQLTESTDYTIGGAIADGDLPASISPDVAYTTVAITNATYHSTNLYVSYYPLGDYVEAPDVLCAGLIMPYAGTSAPSGWLDCDGSAVSRATYNGLFKAIGTTWGSGDGSTTFNVPDLRGLFIRGAGANGTLTDYDSNAYTGGSVGNTSADALRDHDHRINSGKGSHTHDLDLLQGDADGNTVNRFDRSTEANVGTVTTDASTLPQIDTDSVLSANTAIETKPANASCLYIIKT